MAKEQSNELLTLYKCILNYGWRARIGEITEEGVLVVLWKYDGDAPITKFVGLAR